MKEMRDPFWLNKSINISYDCALIAMIIFLVAVALTDAWPAQNDLIYFIEPFTHAHIICKYLNQNYKLT